MTVEKPSPKNIRLTAIDPDGHVKVFLVAARPDDVNQLYKHLIERVRRAKEHQENEDNEVDELSPIKVRIIDTSTNSETGESEDASKAVAVQATSTASAGDSLTDGSSQGTLPE